MMQPEISLEQFRMLCRFGYVLQLDSGNGIWRRSAYNNGGHLAWEFATGSRYAYRLVPP